MKAINNIIVEIDEAYHNEVELDGVGNFIVNSTIENVEHINRVGRVISAPSFINLQEGDNILVHHNIFRLRNGNKGNPIESNYYLGDNKYMVTFTEVFMFKRGKGDWQAIDPYCFVEPIFFKKGSLADEAVDLYKGDRINQVGIMRYPNSALLKQGVNVGDKVAFTEWSEYEFIVDGKLLYKMATKDVIGLL